MGSTRLGSGHRVPTATPTAALLAAVAIVVACAGVGGARAEEANGSPTKTHASIELLRSCIGAKERRSLVEGGAVLRLAVAMRGIRGRLAGTLVRARLCRRGEQLVYVLTVLGHDGKVTRLSVDAAKGSLVGER